MRKKVLIIFAAIFGYAVVLFCEPYIPWPRNKYVVCALFGVQFLVFLWMCVTFARWHRGFHQRVVDAAMRSRESL